MEHLQILQSTETNLHIDAYFFIEFDIHHERFHMYSIQLSHRICCISLQHPHFFQIFQMCIYQKQNANNEHASKVFTEAKQRQINRAQNVYFEIKF